MQVRSLLSAPKIGKYRQIFADFYSSLFTFHSPLAGSIIILSSSFATTLSGCSFLFIRQMSDGDRQTGSLTELISQYPDLRIAIGHFGMVTRDGWTEQIKLAKNKNVRIESGGIIWLFKEEFYPYPSAVRAIKEAADMIKSCGAATIREPWSR